MSRQPVPAGVKLENPMDFLIERLSLPVAAGDSRNETGKKTMFFSGDSHVSDGFVREREEPGGFAKSPKAKENKKIRRTPEITKAHGSECFFFFSVFAAKSAEGEKGG